MEDLIFERPVLLEKEIVKDSEVDAETKQIKKAVQKIAKEHGFCKFKISTTNLSFAGASYLSRLCTIDITDLETEKEINLFIKNLLVMDESINVFAIQDTYDRESFFYNDLAIKISQIQNEFNLPEMERYRLVKSYKSKTNAMIIMENLLCKGYNSPDRMKIPSLDFVKKSVKELAKFKALSMALEKHRPAYYEEVIKSLDYLYKPDETFMQMSTEMLKADLVLQRNEKVREKLAKRIPTMYKRFIELISSQNATCGLSHNDYKPSNSLVKFENGKITDFVIVDYQFVSYTNIINDFLFFIFCSTDRNFRIKHLEYIKNYFFDSIAKHLQFYDIEINDVYPRKVFEQEFQDKLELGLVGPLAMLPFLLAPLDDLPDLSQCADKMFSRNRSPECIRRMNDIGEEFLDWGIL